MSEIWEEGDRHESMRSFVRDGVTVRFYANGEFSASDARVMLADLFQLFEKVKEEGWRGAIYTNEIWHDTEESPFVADKHDL